MKKLILLLYIFIAILTYSQKQAIGLRGGVIFSNINTTDGGNKNRTYKTAWLLNLNYERYINNKISFEIGLQYEVKGFYDYLIYTNDYGDETGKDKITNSYEYVSNPIGVKYTIGNKLKFTGLIGVSPSYLIKGTIVIPETIEVKEHNIDITNRPNRFDLSAFIGVGVSYKILKQFEINLNGIFNHSFLTMTNKNYFEKYSVYNYFYSINIGIKYILKP